jgi:hypothetical protein
LICFEDRDQISEDIQDSEDGQILCYIKYEYQMR